MNITLCTDIDRIRALMARDNLSTAIAQYESAPFVLQDLGTSYYIIISDDDNNDIGIYILDRLSYDCHYSVHVAYIKAARGFQVYAGGMLFVEFMKKLLPHACLLGMPPMSKPGALRHAQMIGFELKAVIPSAIEIGKDKNIDAKRIDMAITALTW